MKQNKIELDIDVIGGESPLTKTEEKAISDYLKSLKQKRRRNNFGLKVPSPKSSKVSS